MVPWWHLAGETGSRPATISPKKGFKVADQAWSYSKWCFFFRWPKHSLLCTNKQTPSVQILNYKIAYNLKLSDKMQAISLPLSLRHFQQTIFCLQFSVRRTYCWRTFSGLACNTCFISSMMWSCENFVLPSNEIHIKNHCLDWVSGNTPSAVRNGKILFQMIFYLKNTICKFN